MTNQRIALLAGLAAFVQSAAAQPLRGVVRDSAGGMPIPGAVVVALDSTGGTVGRNIAGADGSFRVVVSARPHRVQVVRIGFRPTTMFLQGRNVDALDVRLTAIPTLLEHVRVVAARSQCPVRADAAETLALVDQSRAGLLATVVAREANPAEVTRLSFERILDANGLTPVVQSVRAESADRATVSFNAVQSAVDFTRRGFTSDSGGNRTFYGPDADVLLDDGFAAGYCFRIGAPDRQRPHLIGLAFSPASRRGGRVDIDGTLWVDTVARSLSHVEFRYLGLDDLSTGLGSGGTVAFREVSPGVVLIDRWALRLVGAADTIALAAAGQTAVRGYQINEIGGELATARWPDGREWTAPLGTLELTARASDGTPAAGAIIGLLGTDYRATVDTAGHARFTHLIPGPYSAHVHDPGLASIGLTLPLDLSFVASRDSVTTRTVTVPTAATFVGAMCRASGDPGRDAAWVVGRIGTADGRPVQNAQWRMARSGEGGWVPVANNGVTGTSGLFAHCRNVGRGQTIRVQAWRGRETPAVVVRKLTDAVTVIPVVMPATVLARGAGGTAELTGTVLDSVSGAGIPGAFVELVGSGLTAISGADGSFRIADVPRGEHTAEIRTDRLDALGVVSRSTVDFTGAAPVRLHVPTTDQIVAATCGPDTPSSLGILLGTVRRPDNTRPTAVRIVAEWVDQGGTPGAAAAQTVGRTQWLRTRADETGTFRLCGVPAGARIVVRTQVDSAAGAAARPVEVEVDAAERFVRLDIALEPGLALGGTFAGMVVADSTDDPVAGAEVAFPDLKLAVSTNTAGGFRVNDIPPGTHRVQIRRPGFTPITADLAFESNQTIDHRIVLGRLATALAPVQVTETAPVNPEFDQNRKLGLGKFLTRADLDKHAGRRLGDILATVPNMGTVSQGASGAGWVVGKRIPPKLAPRPIPAASAIAGSVGEAPQRGECGVSKETSCTYTMDDLREQGFYCPQGGEQRQGILCACYAQVWLDGRLMNRQRPTEPFDINAVPPEDIEAVEWYSSPSQTPAQYSSLNSPCGVMVIWTRRARPH